MIYFMKRLIYDLFFKGSRFKKFIILIILILLMIFKPMFISAEVAETDSNMQPDPVDQPIDQPAADPEMLKIMQQILAEFKDLRYDLQKDKEDAAALALQEEEAEAEADQLALEEIELYALSQSQNNITYGFLENYRYYFTGSENTDTRASQYIYVFTENTKFRKEGNLLYYENGSCFLIHVTYSGTYVVTAISQDHINLNQGWIYIYSNIPETEKPAVYQISKDSEKAFERFEDFSMCLLALYIGFSVTKLIINGPANKGRGI